MADEKWEIKPISKLENKSISIIVGKVVNQPDAFVLIASQGLKKVTIGCDGLNALAFARDIIKGVRAD